MWRSENAFSLMRRWIGYILLALYLFVLVLLVYKVNAVGSRALTFPHVLLRQSRQSYALPTPETSRHDPMGKVDGENQTADHIRDSHIVNVSSLVPKNGANPSQYELSQRLKAEKPSLMEHRPSKQRQVAHSIPSHCLNWCNRSGKPPFFLTAVILLRIYKADKAKLTTRELKQWLQYLRYAGVEHVWLYDAYITPDESQDKYLGKFYEDSFVTYVDWHEHNPYTITGTQIAAYQDCINKYGKDSKWQISVDMDEYPFSLSDTKPGFLSRAIRKLTSSRPEVTEISMKNYLFLGKPASRELLIDRYWRRTRTEANDLVKPIFQPSKVKAQVHHHDLLSGIRIDAPQENIRLNHYWGARLQEWGEDTPEILGKTEEDRSMQALLDVYNECNKYVRPYIDM